MGLPVAVACMVLRQILGVMLIAAGFSKAIDPQGSMHAVAAYRLIPSGAAKVMGLILPWVELGIGISLIGDIVTEIALRVGAALMLLFAAAQSIVLIRGQETPCGCLGAWSHRMVSWTSLARTICLLIAFLILKHLYYSEMVNSSLLPSGWGSLICLAMVTLSFLQLLCVSQVRQNRRLEWGIR